MTDTRKDIRFALPASSASDFEAAKRRAEQEIGVAMSANEFARRVVVQAVRPRDEVEDFADIFSTGNPYDRLAELYGTKRKEGETDDQLLDRVTRAKT